MQYYAGADWTCRPAAPTRGGPLAQPYIFYELFMNYTIIIMNYICCETYLNFYQKRAIICNLEPFLLASFYVE